MRDGRMVALFAAIAVAVVVRRNRTSCPPEERDQ